MKMSSIHLPILPKDKEYEEYISAILQSNGNFIERNIIERTEEGGIHTLELDIIVTDYKNRKPNFQIIEVKSGAWSFPDIFKIRGYMDYLHVDSGFLIVNEQKRIIGPYEKISYELGIQIKNIPNYSKTTEIIHNDIENNNISVIDIDVWRYSYWLERNLLLKLNEIKKVDTSKKCFKILEDYYFELNNDIFFTKNIILKLIKLFGTFKEYPNLSSKCANELEGNRFNDDYQELPKNIFKDTYFDCHFNIVQISTFIENRARLAIMKNAIDYKLFKNKKILKILGFSHEEELLRFLPQQFKDGLDKISEHKYYHLYPIFWQWFLWVFGGFLLIDHLEKEYEILSLKTGIPLDEIPNALDAYNLLFPSEGGWYIDLPNTNITAFKMFSVPFRGLGAFYRRYIYDEIFSIEKINVGGQFSLNDLKKWNDLAIEILKWT